ncbi:S8 family serine peptidase [Pseudidiomarina sp. 1APP75-32.1]|uniref:S8 family serine peptidase n=1 Tax=Pseudidiomarina terrestris TaxID=2820060 RepID=A0AAW7R469_9GAMM|nr:MULTISPECIES: S8 family serine peptidase [unclassified Pseudidiomarina]MDN7125299.1 S8 family serine peptidase [Pseudidiomarina sp. 1APP75-32.1]MDN7130058.1 S8 family serine peptidase [Pseudidiomarina sp. 1APR75-15]
MKKFALTTIAALTLAAAPGQAMAEAVIGDQLKAKLPVLNASEQIMAVVTYDQLEPVTESQIQQLLDLGLAQGVQFSSLPIIGVLATRQQIESLAQQSDVRSIWLNRQLQYFNADQRKITGVEQLQSNEFIQRNNTSFTGKGVTIMVNDSGIDAAHQDLLYGDTVVENVQAITSAEAISLVAPTDGFVLEGQINTDLNVGHGTHCAGTIAGSGVMSDGKYMGAAPDADLVGYGSGAGVSILDAVGGYDYAINNVYAFNSPIRIMSNSWGSSGKFSPDSPVSIASYKAYKLGILSVFAAGNSGPGEDSHNPYAQIPWGISVGAGDKFGHLAGFSSRGLKGESDTFQMPDNSTWTYNNEVTIVAPGVDIISTRASTNLVSNGGDADLDAIETEYVPFYTMISGTSMATPHVSGIIALMMEANPSLSLLDIKRLLQETATNMPGYQKWEVGAGYVNAKAAVSAALDYDLDYVASVNNLNTFNANALITTSDRVEPFEVLYAPVGEPETHSFQVGEDVAWVKASADTLANTTKLVLVAPDGTEYFGNLTLPVLETGMRVSAPGQAGTWQVYVYGLTSLSGVDPDPLDVTNGPGVPEVISGTVTFELNGGYDGVDDIEGHPQQNAIEFAVSERLVDGFTNGKFRPDRNLERKDLAQYLVMGGAIRQYRDLLNEPQPNLNNVNGDFVAYAEAVSVTGAALKDSDQVQAPVMLSNNGNFDPRGEVSKLDLAYTLVQVLGLEATAKAFDSSQDILVDYRGQTVVLADQDSIPAQMKGYVQTAINYGLLNVQFGIEQGPFDLEPQLTAHFAPATNITRAHYALLTGRLYSNYYELF